MNFVSVSLPLAMIDAFLIPLFLFAVGGVIAVTAIVTNYFRQRNWHKVLHVAVEKGYPIADLSSADPSASAAVAQSNIRCRSFRSWRNDFRAGLIFIAIGVGLHFGFRDLAREGISHGVSFELIPALIGVALIINAIVTAAFPPKPEALSIVEPKR